MIYFPHAKINLGLNVVEKRADGYHNIESIFYPAGLCDVLEVVESPGQEETITLTSSGIKIPGDTNDNLCLLAYRLLQNDHALPKVKIHLHKIIPLGAGLGGGSSDAIAFIKLMNEKFDLNISWGEMHHYARQLGSDCSFFVSGRPSLVQGRGDECEAISLNLSGYFIFIVYPGIHISTKEAYAGVVPINPSCSLEEAISSLPVEEWKGVIKNDFEKTIFEKYPLIGEIKHRLYACGALYASMSGSGSAVYGLFKAPPDLKKEFGRYFTWQGDL